MKFLKDTQDFSIFVVGTHHAYLLVNPARGGFNLLCLFKFSLRQRINEMKLVTAIIKPFKVEAAREALSGIGVSGLTVTEVKGFGRQKGHTELYRGAEYIVDFLPKSKLEVGVDDEQVAEVVEVIKHSSATGKIGDGKIFVTELTEVVRIRTGETGSDAL